MWDYFIVVVGGLLALLVLIVAVSWYLSRDEAEKHPRSDL